MSTHAVLSPSGAHRWMACPGSAALEQGCPDEGSDYAAEGTAAHLLAAMVFEGGTDSASAFLGRLMRVDGKDYEVTEDMAAAVDVYVTAVRSESSGKELLVEQEVSIEHLTGETGAVGTADAVAIGVETLDVHDLKYGMGVRVAAEDNPQLMMYASGVLRAHSLVADFKRIRMFIHQPRLDHIDMWECSLDEMREFEANANHAARLADEQLRSGNPTRLTPGDKQCRFCKAKAICPALSAAVEEAVGADFASMPEQLPVQADEPGILATKFRATGIIELWIKAVRAEVERRLLSGVLVPGYKLVEGRRGNRKWADESEVEELLKSFRLKKEEMYEYSLITPPTAEKLLKDTPKRWVRLSALITQSEGKPSVAPVEDKRPAIAVSKPEDDFAMVPHG